MKHLSKLLIVALMATTFFACSKKSDDPVVPVTPVVTVKGTATLIGDIKGTRNLSADTIYTISGFTYVISGATLNIPAGTILKGDKGTKGTLIVEAGGKINANGTVDKPVVFTSSQPAGARNYGDWGGLVLIGKAPTNRPSATTFEGGIRGTYGTFTDAADNSGILKYVRIEFCGIGLSAAANSEVNGLTLYGVGSGTTIEYVQVSYSGDDSFEWFGGTVNAKYLIAHRGWDDDFDTDFGFTGNVQFAVSLRDPLFADQSGSNGFESDNFGGTGTPANAANDGLPLTQPGFSNVSIFTNNGTPSNVQQSGNGAYQSAMHLRRNTAINIYNTVIVGYPEGLRLDGTAAYTNATTPTVNGTLTLKAITLSNVSIPYSGAIGTGITAGSETTTPATSLVKAYFETAGNSNSSTSTVASLTLNANTFNLTSPNFVPVTGSPLLTGAIFDGKVAGAFFDKAVTYKGAFGTTDWTATWTNFNPQTTVYE